jgi:pimeloyl-ACP methyl ester carboxylesterase
VKGLTSEVRTWLEQGAFARVDGVDLFYRVAGGDRRDLPWLVCFHGFPTSSWDWHSLLRTPGVGAVAARLTSWRLFRRQYPNVYANPSRFDEQHYRSQWSLMLHNGGRRVLHKIAGYMKERTRMGEQWTGPLEHLDLPLRVIWGDRDPIAVYAIAQRLCSRNPRAALHTLEGVGHYPQLEAPRRVAEALGF